jgi:predicted component of viral defense system (DUF524 family)
MARVNNLEVPLQDATGFQFGVLRISCTPGQESPPLWDYRGSPESDPTLQDLRVLESEEYIYRLEGMTLGTITTDKPELFMPDYFNGQTGRFRPGLNVGEISVTFSSNGNPVGSVAFEVLSKKIHYLSDYQAMIRNIASYLAEIIAERFAPAEQAFSPLESRNAVTLYQQFAFVRAFLTGNEFREAIRRIVATPDQHWVTSDVEQPLARGIRHVDGFVRALLGPGPRQSNPGLIVKSQTLPVFVRGQVLLEDVDTPENRFIFHILGSWLDLAVLVRDRLAANQGGAQQRGIREAEEVIAILEETLSASLFRKLGKIGFIPASSTVLDRKEGYREIYRVFLEGQLAAQLSWHGAEDVYGAGKKNVALLYEYWVFLILAGIISTLCKLKPPNVSSLIEKTPDGLSLKLRQDRRFALRGLIERHGKKIDVVLYYNRTFKPTENLETGTWTREMVPDFSVLIREAGHPQNSTWLHFDAKYKVDTLLELFGPESHKGFNPKGGKNSKSPIVSYKREDLLKMHAYKDAVRRSTGAFVLYPGTEKTLFKQFTEIVPGIGAFSLRPTETSPEGAAHVEQFLSDVIDLFASAKASPSTNG